MPSTSAGELHVLNSSVARNVLLHILHSAPWNMLPASTQPVSNELPCLPALSRRLHHSNFRAHLDFVLYQEPLHGLIRLAPSLLLREETRTPVNPLSACQELLEVHVLLTRLPDVHLLECMYFENVLF